MCIVKIDISESFITNKNSLPFYEDNLDTDNLKVEDREDIKQSEDDKTD